MLAWWASRTDQRQSVTPTATPIITPAAVANPSEPKRAATRVPKKNQIRLAQNSKPQPRIQLPAEARSRDQSYQGRRVLRSSGEGDLLDTARGADQLVDVFDAVGLAPRGQLAEDAPRRLGVEEGRCTDLDRSGARHHELDDILA